ncbi:MAG TPA: o-succinylbenzoate synthase [Microbacteriaceae bacterium]|nr:o-succinylbenzoate synthase [Microbacteriaceae bacterium]
MRVPELAELTADAHVVALPLRTPFRGLNIRETLLVRGPAGWSEFAPFEEYDDSEAAEWLRATIEFGWDQTLTTVRASVPVNATVPAVAPADVPGMLSQFPGSMTAKIKVAGTTLDADIARVGAVRALLGPAGRIRLDANGGWTLDEAERAIRRLALFDLDYVEQPCETVDELAELRERIADTGIAIAADESVRRASDPLAVARAGAADLLVLKAAPLGGVRRAEAIIAEAGLPVVVSSALESAIGLGLGALLAARLEAPEAAGLGTSGLFMTDVAARPVRDGQVSTARLEPDPAALRALACAPERREWWLDRLERCLRLVERSS